MYVFFIFIVILEVVSYYIYKSKPKKLISGIEYINFLTDKAEMNTNKFITKPFSLYWNSPNLIENGIQITDRNGFRYSGYDFEIKKRSLRILVYGASTTFSRNVKPWPNLVSELFQKNENKFIEFINAGLDFSTSAELLSHFIFNGSAFEPDILIIENPGNDSVPLMVGDESLDYMHTRSSLSISRRKHEKFFLTHVAIIRLIYAIWLRDQTLLSLRPNNRIAEELRNQNLLTGEPIAFEKNIKTFIELCTIRKIKVILIDFLINNKATAILKPITSQGIFAVNKKMNNLFAEMSQDSNGNILHVHLDSEDFNDDDFSDSVHLNQKGESKKSMIIYELIKNAFLK